MRVVALNAEFLLEEWVDHLLQTRPEAHQFARRIWMTSEQKFHLALWNTWALDGWESTAQDTIAFLRNPYGLRARAGRVSEEALMHETIAAYIRTGGRRAHGDIVTAPDVFRAIK